LLYFSRSIVFPKENQVSIQKRILEIRAAEGGCDARLFVAELAQAYLKLADRKG